MNGFLFLFILLVVNTVSGQSLKTFTLFSLASATDDNRLFEVDEDQTRLLNKAYLNAINKSGSIELNLGAESNKEKYSLFEICQILDSKSDSNDFAVYNFIGGWRSSLHDEYDLITSANIKVTSSYVLNFLSMNRAKNQLLVFLMPKGYTLSIKPVSQNSTNLTSGNNILLIQQTNQSKFTSLVDDYISAIEKISNLAKFDANKDNLISVSEFFFQLEHFLKEENINFEVINLTKAPDINLLEVR